MNFEFRKLGKIRFIQNVGNSFLYFGASIIGLIISIFTTPIFARILDSQDFAIIGYFTAINNFVFPFYTLLFYSFYIANYFKKGEEENKDTLGTLVIFLSIWNFIFSAIVYLFLIGYFQITNVSLPLYPFALIILLTSIFSVYKSFLTINYRIRKKAWQFFFIMTAAKIFNVFFSLILVAIFSLGAQGKLIGILIGEIIIAAVSLYKLKDYMNFKYDSIILRSALRFSFPLVVSSFPHLVIVNYDSVILEKLNNVNEFALYSIGTTISGYLLLMGTSIFQAFEPDVYKFVGSGQYKKLFIYIALVVFTIITITIIFIYFSKDVLEYLTAGRYTLAYKYTNILSVSIIFYILYSFLSAIILALEKSKIALYITAFVGISSLFVYNQFIGSWGFMGAAYAKILLFALLSSISLTYILYNIKTKNI